MQAHCHVAEDFVEVAAEGGHNRNTHFLIWHLRGLLLDRAVLSSWSAFAEPDQRGKNFSRAPGECLSLPSRIPPIPSNLVCWSTEAQLAQTNATICGAPRAYLELGPEAENFKTDKVLLQGVDHVIVALRVGRLQKKAGVDE